MERVGHLQDRVDRGQEVGKVVDQPLGLTGSGPVVKTVLVPIDGSPLAERALGVAAGLALSFKADLRLFKASFKLDLHDEVAQLRGLADRHGLPRAQVEVSTGRSAAPAVIHSSRRSDDTVVVMATQGRSGIAATVLGSIAGEVLRDLDEPLVLVGPGYEDRGDLAGIVVCWDGTLLSASVMPTAAAWAKELELPVRLVHVRGAADPPLGGEVGSAEDRLTAQVIEALTVNGRQPEVTEISNEDPAQGVLGLFDDQWGGSLVALATKGRGGLLSSALGRVSSKIVQGSPHPLLVSHLRP